MVNVELRCTSDMQQACYTFNNVWAIYSSLQNSQFFLKIGLA